MVEDARNPAHPLLPKQRVELVVGGAQQQLGEGSLARMAGVTVKTWARWRATARMEEAMAEAGHPLGPHAALMREVDQARSEGEMMLSQTVFFAAVGTEERPGDPKLALEVLSRRAPSDWAPMSKFRVDQGEADEMAGLLALAAIGSGEERVGEVAEGDDSADADMDELVRMIATGEASGAATPSGPHDFNGDAEEIARLIGTPEDDEDEDVDAEDPFS